MALFSYQAFSKVGKKVSGTLDAPSLGSARELLQQQGFFPISIIPTHKIAAHENFIQRFFQASVPLKDKLLFTKQLAVLLRSGIQLVQALELLSEQFEGKMNRIIVTIKDGIKEGQSLADGLKQYPYVFENIYVQLVRSGEASGKLEVILERLTHYLERQGELQSKVSSALRGPLIQLALIFGASCALMVLVVPQLASVFEGVGMKLPLPTRMVMGFSNFMTDHYLLLIGIIGAIVFSYLYWVSTPSGALTIDKIKLRLPIISLFTRTGAIVQFCGTLGMLLEGGVNLPEALDIVVGIVDNRILKKSLKEAREKIIKQGQMAQYLKQTGIFPPMATYLINTGEQSGKLDMMLLLVGSNYEKDLEEFADNLTVLIGPIMTVVTSVIVGFIVLSIMMPMSQMNQMAK
jgi:type II secretory pathway component PulF